MARTCWIIDNISIAKKVKHAGKTPSSLQINDCGASRECPQCHYLIDNKDVTNEWPGLPAGVKFDPSDLQLIHHLAAKCGIPNSKPHSFIDQFIPTLDSDHGICYTHPENLPGAMKDGTSVHFFHRTAKAYATGQRKRRKIQTQQEKQVRWHKTGKTKPVFENGIQKGCKKIMVLYNSSRKGFKSDKANWVMHQYHLGLDDDENECDFVVSKIFHQLPKQSELKVADADVDATADVEEFSLNDFDESLIYKDIIGPSYDEHETNHVSSVFADIENLELDTLPEFSLTGLYFGSQDSVSVFDWLDRR